MNLLKSILFSVLILFGILTCIHPLYPNEQFLQHLGTVILLAVLFADLRKNKLTLFAFSFFSAFILLHIIGARYIYSYVPYDKWINAVSGFLTGKSLMEIGSRNAYDRFVHLAFGILVFPIVFDYLSRRISDKVMLIVSTWAILQTVSMLYELFEWGLTLVLSTEAANDYNGQQGDLWDAQKDMFLALVGSTAMSIIYALCFKQKKG
jgi:putative membrane protein